MRSSFFLLATLVACFLVTSCASGPAKRVSPPAASIQQITVLDDGQWEVLLRLQNFSSMAMSFSAGNLTLSSGSTTALTITALPTSSVSPESADIVRLIVTPTPDARQLAAGILADARPLPYQLKGHILGAATDKRSKSWPIDFRSTLHPAPGLPGVLR